MPDAALPDTALHPGDAPAEFATPEQKQQLLDMISQIRSKLGEYHATRFAGQNEVESNRKVLLRAVLDGLQRAGVNLKDRKAVSKFIANLEAQSPLRADMFRHAMDSLLGKPGAQAPRPKLVDVNERANPNDTEAVPQGV